MKEHGSEEKHYQIHFEYRGQYLFAQVTGETDSLEISLQFWTEILKQARQHNYLKVLVQENFQTDLSTFDSYILNQQLGQLGFYNTKIAFVDLEASHHSTNLFGETVANNRGLYLKVFTALEEAETWLLQN